MPLELCRNVAEGVILSVRVTPKSSRNEVAGLHQAADGAKALSVKVSAPPEKGKANRAVVEVLAKALKVPKSSLALVSGDASRNKTILLNGKADEMRSLIERLIQDLKG